MTNQLGVVREVIATGLHGARGAAFPKISGGDARSGLWGGLTESVIGGGIHDEISNKVVVTM